MNERKLRKRVRKLWWVAIAAIIFIIPTISTMAASSPVTAINVPGFGDPQNSYSWAMAWFKGSLYVGTVRSASCVQYATYAYYGIGKYSTNPSPGVTCPANPFDMDLRAEIWRYSPSSPTSGQWTRVYQSPVIPNPEDTTKNIAVDIGYRGMGVYTASNGDQTLYVAGVSAESFIPEMSDVAPPRILATTDGENYTALSLPTYQILDASDPPMLVDPVGYRSIVEYHERLFVTSTSGLAGNGALMEVGNLDSPTQTITQVTPDGTQVFEIETFNDQLYVGTGDNNNGYGVLRTDASGSAPFTYTEVVGNGAGRGKEITSVVSMHVFNNRLYVGASGWYNSPFPASELIRIAPDDTWELVVGDPRDTTNGPMTPISGLPDGYGNVFNAHFWRMEDINDGLYVGTNDWSDKLANLAIIKALLGWQFGFDIYGSCNGQFWFPVTLSAFGTGLYNFGARTMVNSRTDVGGFIGSANNATGTRVYSTNGTQGIPKCAAFTTSAYWDAPFSSVTQNANGAFSRSFRSAFDGSVAFNASSDSSRPTMLQADMQANGTVLSWNPVQGARQYRVFRATSTSNSQVGVPQPQQPSRRMPGGFSLDDPTTFGSTTPNVGIMGDFVAIGTTKDAYFVDKTAVQGVTYSYTVRAESGLYQVSGDSNVIVTPIGATTTSFDSVTSTISSLAAKNQISAEDSANLTSQLNDARTQRDQGDLQQSVKTIGAVIDEVMPSTGLIADQTYAEELVSQLSSLQRNVALRDIAATSTSPGPRQRGSRGGSGSTTGTNVPVSTNSGSLPTSGISWFQGVR